MKLIATKYIIIALILFSFKGSKCNYINDYYQTVHKAEIYYLRNEDQKALNLLKQAERKCNLLNRIGVYEQVMMAELLVRLGKEKKAFPYLYSALNEGVTFEMLKNNPEFKSIRQNKDWKKLKEDAPKIEAIFQNSINLELRNEIIKMNIADQQVRKGNADFKKRKTVDSLNETRMKEIFIKYGYPSYKLIGYPKINEDTDIGAMLMHFKDTLFFKPRLLEFINNGQAPPEKLANMIDSQQRSIGIFTYGIYQNVDSTKIKDFKNIDKRRKSIGLRPYQLEKEYWRLIRIKYGIPE